MRQLIKNSLKLFLVVTALCFGLATVAVPAFAQQPSCSNDVTTGVGGGANCAAPTNAKVNLFGTSGVFVVVVDAILFVIGMVAVVMLIMGGIHYVTSSGDQAAVTKAKNTILYALIGIVIAFMAYAVVNFVIAQFNKAS